MCVMCFLGNYNNNLIIFRSSKIYRGLEIFVSTEYIYIGLIKQISENHSNLYIFILMKFHVDKGDGVRNTKFQQKVESNTD